MSPDLSIDLVKPDDFGTVAAIYNEAIEQGKSSMEENLYTAKKIAAWVEKFNNRERLYVLRKAGTIIGWGIIKRYSDREGYRFAAETAVYLQFSELGQGYGTLIKKHLIEICRALDYHHLVAKIFASNIGSIEYNRKFGYEIVGRQKEIGFKDGQWTDVIIMQYLIQK